MEIALTCLMGFDPYLRGGSLTKIEQSLFKICEKGEEEGQNWDNSKACTF